MKFITLRTLDNLPININVSQIESVLQTYTSTYWEGKKALITTVFVNGNLIKVRTETHEILRLIKELTNGN